MKITILLIMMMISILSCQKFDIENGNFVSIGKSKVSNEESYENAKGNLYDNLVEYVAGITQRSDTNVIYYSLVDGNILTFEDYDIKSNKIFATYRTTIKINDESIKEKLDNFAVSFQREGEVVNVENPENISIRGYASIDFPDTLSLYTKSVLERDAFNRAKENIKKDLVKKDIDIQKVEDIISSAYIVEETYSGKLYTVVVEVEVIL